MDPDNLSRIEIGVSHCAQVPVDKTVDNYSRLSTSSSSTSLTENVPQPAHWANHSCSVSSLPFVIKCCWRASP